MINFRSANDPLGQTSTYKAIQKLSAEVQTVSSRCGSQALDIQNLYQELKTYDSKLEDILRNELQVLKKGLTANVAHPKVNSNKQNDILERLQAEMVEMRENLEKIQNDRLRFEYTMQNG